MKKVNVKSLLILAVTITVCQISSLNYMQSVRAESNPRVTGEILGVVTLDYDRKTGEGGPLSTLGSVRLNNLGIIEGNKGKSGWITINTWGTYTDKTTKTKQKVSLKGVSFWVNKGGKNWWDFEVQEAYLEGEGGKLTIETKIEQIDPGINRLVIILEEKYKLVPVVHSLNNITFSEEVFYIEKQEPTSHEVQTTQKIAVLPICWRDSLDKDCEYTKAVSEILTNKLSRAGSFDVVSQSQVLDAVRSVGLSYYNLRSTKHFEKIRDTLSVKILITAGPYPSTMGGWFMYKICRSRDWMCKGISQGAGFPDQVQDPKVDDKNILKPILNAVDEVTWDTSNNVPKWEGFTEKVKPSTKNLEDYLKVRDVIEHFEKNEEAIMRRVNATTQILSKLGITTQDLNNYLIDAFNLENTKGALIADIEKNSNAEKAGLQRGDVIKEFDGQKVNDPSSLKIMTDNTLSGKEVMIKIIRDSNPMTVRAIIIEK